MKLGYCIFLTITAQVCWYLELQSENGFLNDELKKKMATYLVWIIHYNNYCNAISDSFTNSHTNIELNRKKLRYFRFILNIICYFLDRGLHILYVTYFWTSCATTYTLFTFIIVITEICKRFIPACESSL